MARLSTRRLLALRSKLLKLEDSLENSDFSPAEIPQERVYFKDDPRWVEMKAALDRILTTREHVAKSDVPRLERPRHDG